MKSGLILSAACLLFASAGAELAQAGGMVPFPGRTITGNYYQPYAARAHQQNAINQSQVLQYYSQAHQAIPVETAQTLVVEIKHHVTVVQAELDKAAQEAKGVPEEMKLISEIQTHQANALKECGMLESECAKHPGGSVEMPECCSRMHAELNAASAAHDKLLKYLKAPVVPTT